MQLIGAVLLNSLGEKFPTLSGNGELLKNPEKYVLVEDSQEKPKIGQYEMAGGLLLAGAVFVVSRVFSKISCRQFGPVSLHMYAYMVVIYSNP